MKEDVGPTIEFPCRKKIIPNTRMITPKPIIDILALIQIIRQIRNKRQNELIK